MVHLTLPPRSVGQWKACPKCGESEPLYTGKVRYAERMNRYWTIACSSCWHAWEVKTYNAAQLEHVDKLDRSLIKWPEYPATG